MNPADELRDRWHRLCGRAGLRDCAALGEDLLARYSEPQRAFHTTAHLLQVVALLEELGADDRLLLAAWFHDAVYQPGRKDNEPLSAALARAALAPPGYAPASIDFVCEAVLATASHSSPRAEFAPLLDADLSILGAAPEDYRHYCETVRREFRLLPDAAFRVGRAAFLRSVLERPQIFQTPACVARFEQRARENLQSELRRLS